VACMRAYIGHIWGHTWATWEQQWGMYARIHGPYMGAAMGHIWGQQCGMHARIHGPHGISPTRKGGREQQVIPYLPLPSLPFPSLFRSVASLNPLLNYAATSSTYRIKILFSI